VTDEANMMQFDFNDLEALLDINNVPTYTPMDATTEEFMLNNNFMQAEIPMEVKNEHNISSGQLFIESVAESSGGWVQSQEVVIPNEQPQGKNYLLIKIPEDLQDSSSFDTLPSLQLKPNTVRDINKASAGHDGVYLTMPENILEPTPSKKQVVNIIRRKPLQVIQTVVPVVAYEPKVQEVKVNKRKQQFKLTREDGVIFLGDSPEPEEKRKRFDTEEWFASFVQSTSSSAGAKKVQAPPDESNRCPGCKKIFKNVANHKCKKFATGELKEPMSCASCGKKYKSKKGLINHFKKCDQSKVFEDKPEFSDTDDAEENFMEQVKASSPTNQEPDIISEDVPSEVKVKRELPGPETQEQLICKEEKISQDVLMMMDAIDDTTVKQEKLVPSEMETEDSVIPLKAENSQAVIKTPIFSIKHKEAGPKITKKTGARRGKKTVAKRFKKTVEMKKESGPKFESSDEKPAGHKRASVEKPSTRLSTKQVKMLTRSAKKKGV
jgi:uncharacterized protein with PIN domain